MVSPVRWRQPPWAGYSGRRANPWLARGSAGRLDARVLAVSAKQVVGGLVAVAMFLGGGFLALAGMGYIGDSAGTSRSWSMIGSLLAGLGVALVITLFHRSR